MNHVITALGAIALCLVVWRFLFWLREGIRLQKPGYLPPPPTRFGRLVYKLFCRVGVRLIVGPVKVIGREHAQFDGRLMILANHQHITDFGVVRAAMPYSYRQIGAAKEMKGYRAPFAAYFGSFSVQVQGGRSVAGHQAADAAIDACATVLAETPHSKLLVFPQGMLVYDNVLREADFRTGAIRALKRTAQKIAGERLAVQPVAVHLWQPTGRECLPRRLFVWAWATFFPNYGSRPKTGATVVIGEPIEFSQFPEEQHEAIEFFRQRLKVLLDEAIAASPAA